MLIPDQETAVDFLNYEAVAKTVVALLKENREQQWRWRSGGIGPQESEELGQKNCYWHK